MARRTWQANFRHTSARYLPRPVTFTLHATIARPEGLREVQIELTRDEVAMVGRHFDRFLWRTDPAGVWAQYPDTWRACHCGYPVLDGHLTCGRTICGTQQDAELQVRELPPPRDASIGEQLPIPARRKR